MPERYWDREREERGRRYRGEGYYGGYYDTPEREREWGARGEERGFRERDWGGRGEERGFFDRAGDEVRSWFGDEEAQRRRQRDEREEGGRWGGMRRGPEPGEREWARQWGHVERRSGQESEPSWSRGRGYAGGYGYQGGRRQWSGSGGYEPGIDVERGREEWWSGPEYGSERYGGGWRSGVSQGPYVGRGPRGYRRSDERIHEDICERMCEDGDLDASDIEITVSSGEVTLRGSVNDRRDKRLAEDLAEQVSGVRDVRNELRVGRAEAGQPAPGVRPEGQQPRAA
jgi:osmotically-inducible protein OsmY